ncbi:hypothetical protein EIP86_006423 [Pleurotus ostreatoroseus]|nr:hypothetical protein EIP86_006423 [Pleurotus ostreatoroseus]
MFNPSSLPQKTEFIPRTASPAPSNTSSMMDIDSDTGDSDRMSVDMDHGVDTKSNLATGSAFSDAGVQQAEPPGLAAQRQVAQDEDVQAGGHAQLVDGEQVQVQSAGAFSLNAHSVNAMEGDWWAHIREWEEELAAYWASLFLSGPSESQLLDKLMSSFDTATSAPPMPAPKPALTSFLDSLPKWPGLATITITEPMQRPIADRLPTELLQILFESLDYGTLEKDYLCACSRVSRRWRAIALPYLFRAIRIRFHADEGASCTHRRRTLRSMHQFFAHNHQFAAYVYELQLVLVCDGRPFDDSVAELTGNATGQPMSRSIYPLVDGDELRLALLDFSKLDQLKLYDVVLRGRPSSSDTINVRKLRLQFPTRSQEPLDVVEHLALFFLFGFVDELWIGAFRMQARQIGRTITIPPLRLRVVHIETTAGPAYYWALYIMVTRSKTLRHVEVTFFPESHKPYMEYAPRVVDESQLQVISVVMSYSMAQEETFSDAFDCWFAFLQLSSPEVPLVVLFIDHATETAFVQQGKNLRKIASGVVKHLRLLAATKHLPDASVCFMSISESRVHLFPFELGWDGRHFEQPRVFTWHKTTRKSPFREPSDELHMKEIVDRKSVSSSRTVVTVSDEEDWEDEPVMNLARPDEKSPSPPSSYVRGSGARKRRNGKPVFVAQPTPTRRYPSVRAKTAKDDEPPLIDIDRARLRGVVRDGTAYTLEYVFYVVKTALSLLRKPLAFALFLYILSLLFHQARSALNTVFSPVCWIPGISRTPLCYVPPPAPKIPKWADYPKLVEVQGSRFEKLLDESFGNSDISQDIKRAEMATSDLVTLVKVSDLKSKETLAMHLEGFISDAKQVGRGLQKLSSRIGGAVDSIIAVNDYALHTIEAAQSKSKSALSVWPFYSAAAIEETVRDTFTQSMSVIEAHIVRVVTEATLALGALEHLEERVNTLHESIVRENSSLIHEREELFAELWTILGGNRKKVRKVDQHLFLLSSISDYRRRALAQVSAALQTMQGMSEDMEDLRERVAAPELMGERIPVEVHLKSIKAGLDRLQSDRKRTKERDDEVMRRILGVDAAIEGV